MRNCWLLRIAGAVCVAALMMAAFAPVSVYGEEEHEWPVVPGDENGVPVVPDPSNVDPPEIEDMLQANPKFPVMEGPADTTFVFEVEFNFRSGDPGGRSFDLTVTGPPDWLLYAAESAMNLENQISAIHLEPYTVGQPVAVVAVAPFWLYPESGEYDIDMRISGAQLEDSVSLTAVITPRYELEADTTTGLDTARTTVGQDATLDLSLVNAGTAPMNSVVLSAELPPDVNGEAWTVAFDPPLVTDLAPGAETEVQVYVTPPPDAIPGDYMATVKFDGEPALSGAPPEVPVRILVSGQGTSWILPGVIALILIAGGVYGYRRLARRKA